MKIYLGGIYGSGIAAPRSRSINSRITARVRPPCVMESFHYANAAMVAAIRRDRQTIFLDSGAFTAHSQGIRIKLSQYANFIRRHHDVISLAANLDVIGAGNEQWSYERQKTLETLLAPDGLSQLVMPVHHVRDHDDWLQRYLDDGYQHIGLGGMVGERKNPKRLTRWLDYVWGRYLTHADGTPKVKVHGFGLTSRKFMFRYPWHSLDSGTWMRVSRYGGVLMDFHFGKGRISDYKVQFSERSPTRFEPNSWHYAALSRDDRKAVDVRLEQLEAERMRDPETEQAFRDEFGIKMGFNAGALGKSYALRDLMNIGYYQRVMGRGVNKFEHHTIRSGFANA